MRMPATGPWAPARTLVAVRAMVPVTQKPPKSAEPTLAMPCATSSVFERWRRPVMPSATTAESSDSIEPSSAKLKAAGRTAMTFVQPRPAAPGRAATSGMPPKRGADRRDRQAERPAGDGGERDDDQHARPVRPQRFSADDDGDVEPSESARAAG